MQCRGSFFVRDHDIVDLTVETVNLFLLTLLSEVLLQNLDHPTLLVCVCNRKEILEQEHRRSSHVMKCIPMIQIEMMEINFEFVVQKTKAL